MTILILNWRDIKNPASGGAEILTHELASRFVKDGHSVIQFSSYYPNAKSKERIDGVEIIRQGKPDARALFESVHYKAYKYYNKNLLGKIDLVIDEVHGIPFFTSLYVREKKILLVCEVAGKIWDIAFRFPYNIFGKMTERAYPFFYKNTKVVTISESTKKDLQKIGFSKKNISVIPLGCSTPVVKSLPKKAKQPTLAFVARLTKAKGIEDALEVVSLLKKKIPDVKLNIIGRGDPRYILKLNEKVKKMKIVNNVKFHGFVRENKKQEILGSSHILIVPSAKEGWGLTVHEAGSRGTPSIGYNVEGLREVIVDGVNGYLCKDNKPKSIADLCIKLFENKTLYSKLQSGAVGERKKYNWNNTYRRFFETVKNV